MLKGKIKALFEKKKEVGSNWIFAETKLSEVTDVLKNPARGWYQIYTFQAEEEPDFKELEWCLDSKDTLAFVLINIGSYRDKELDSTCMNRLRDILRFFQKNGYDIILRVVYDHEGKAMEREPFFFAQVLGHLEQVGELLREFADTIFVYQGMLVGNWGEMHTSRFLKKDKLTEMAQKLRFFKGEQTYLAVRRPVHWRLLHPADTQPANCTDGMGLFDDGMFGSESHLGTFGVQLRENAGWDEAWSREEEMTFEDELCQVVPNGGEAVYKENCRQSLTQDGVLRDLQRMHITYLNKIHDARILDIWRNWLYRGPGVWMGRSVYDYVGAHLGYRFLIQKVRMPQYSVGEERAQLEITIKNTGFAAFYQDAELYVECRDEKGEVRSWKLDDNMKGWKSGEVRDLVCPVELWECSVFLLAKRSRDGAVIHFANASDEMGGVEIGSIKLG